MLKELGKSTVSKITQKQSQVASENIEPTRPVPTSLLEIPWADEASNMESNPLLKPILDRGPDFQSCILQNNGNEYTLAYR